MGLSQLRKQLVVNMKKYKDHNCYINNYFYYNSTLLCMLDVLKMLNSSISDFQSVPISLFFFLFLFLCIHSRNAFISF